MLQKLKTKCANSLIIGHINNSLRNKFEMLENCIKGNVDILLISETKLGESFLLVNFKMMVSPLRK